MNSNDKRKQIKYRKRMSAIQRRDRIMKNIIIILTIVLCACVFIIFKINHNANEKKKNLAKNPQTTSVPQKQASKSLYKTNWVVTAPKNRSKKEIINFFKKYQSEDDNIKYIYQHVNDYSDELLDKVINNPEMTEFVRYSYDQPSGIKCQLNSSEKKQKYPLFLQWDKRWGYKPYGDSNIGLAGCGPTCLAMVTFSLTHNSKITPAAVTKYSEKNGFYVEGTGTAWALMTDYPAQYGITVNEVSLSEDAIKNRLSNDGLIICAMGKGDFTRNGHFIVIYGYDKNGFKINDPYSAYRSKKRWSFARLAGQIKAIWSYERSQSTTTLNPGAKG